MQAQEQTPVEAESVSVVTPPTPEMHSVQPVRGYYQISSAGPAPTPAHLLASAFERGADMQTLERLIALQERMEANEARKEFTRAMARFKANPPEILKDLRNVQYDSMYSSLAEITNKVSPALSLQGLSARWSLSQEGRISVSCIVTHEGGHSESVSLNGPPDDSGKKNPLQQIKSTVTYLESATLLAVLGLAAKGVGDDDGNDSEPIEIISSNQLAALNKKIDGVTNEKNRDAYIKKLLDFLKVDALENIPATSLQKAEQSIADRAKRMQEKKEQPK